jgi:hypothetical protein
VDKKKENKLKAVVKITRAIKKVHYRNEVPKFRGIKLSKQETMSTLNTARNKSIKRHASYMNRHMLFNAKSI